ncbi:sensor domain-containing protein [Actinocorallia lasiicapitis]
MLRRPFTRSTWAWTAYALLNLPLALAGTLTVLPLLAVGVILTLTPFGLWVLAVAVRCAVRLSGVSVRLSASLLGDHLTPPRLRTEPGLLGWRRTSLADASGWLAVCYVLLKLPLAVAVCATTVLSWGYSIVLISYPLTREQNAPSFRTADGDVHHALRIGGTALDGVATELLVSLAGVALLSLTPFLIARFVSLDRLLQRGLLNGGQSARIQILEASRALAVADAVGTLRRIERDLHDGAQSRLVTLMMNLTMARETLATEANGADLPRTSALVDAAHTLASEAIVELRTLARGIRPPVLDKGLPPALETLAGQSALPVDLITDIPERPSAAIETIAYFCAAELLTNAIRHSGAELVVIEAVIEAGMLRLRVTDDGGGGAAVGLGSGLSGLAARASTVDGRLDVTSPRGGPTTVTVQLPISN